MDLGPTMTSESCRRTQDHAAKTPDTFVDAALFNDTLWAGLGRLGMLGMLACLLGMLG